MIFSNVRFGLQTRLDSRMSIGKIEDVPSQLCWFRRGIKKGIARWDAFVHVPDPDALAAELVSRGVEFFVPLKGSEDEDGLRGFEVRDPDGYVLFFGRAR